MAVRGAMLSVALLVAGCANRLDASVGPVLSGRLAVHVDAQPGAPANSFSSAFELSGDETRGQMRLTSPLGAQLALAQWGDGGVELTTSQGSQRFSDLASLSSNVLGAALPLGALTHWLKGQAWPGAPSEPLGSGQGFRQLGWTIDLARYAPDHLIQAHSDGPPGIDVRAKIDSPS
jgi:outer membrane lipoprotein LolB